MFNFLKREDKQILVSVSNRTIIRVIAMVIISILFLAALRRASHALVLIFISFFLSLALNAPVHWLAEHLPGKRKGSRTLATALSFLLVILLLAAFIASIVPPLVRQTNNFLQAAPSLIENVRNQDSGLGHFIRNYHLQGQIGNFSSQLSNRLQNIATSSLSTVTRISSSIFSVLTIFVFTFMMLIEGPYWIQLLKRLLPKSEHEHIELLARDMYKVIRGYVNGQVLLAALAALLIVVPLFILNVSYPIALMVVVFICGLVPLIGHSIGAAIISVVALFHSPIAAIIILAYYILYMQIEAYVIQPRIQATTTNMSPLLVFASVIVGVSFSGLLGGLMAIPLAGCLKVFIVDYVKTHRLLND